MNPHSSSQREEQLNEYLYRLGSQHGLVRPQLSFNQNSNAGYYGGSSMMTGPQNSQIHLNNNTNMNSNTNMNNNTNPQYYPPRTQPMPGLDYRMPWNTADESFFSLPNNTFHQQQQQLQLQQAPAMMRMPRDVEQNQYALPATGAPMMMGEGTPYSHLGLVGPSAQHGTMNVMDRFPNNSVDITINSGDKRSRDCYYYQPAEHGTTRKKKTKRSDDMPRRPLSAYNFFFSEEREIVLAILPAPVDGKHMKLEEAKELLSKHEFSEEEHVELNEKVKENSKLLLSIHLEGDRIKKKHNKSHGKIAFQSLAKVIGERWRNLSEDKKDYYVDLANQDLTRYNEQMRDMQLMKHDEVPKQNTTTKSQLNEE